jgi:hypothetical protein
MESIFKTALGVDNCPKHWHLLGWEIGARLCILRSVIVCALRRASIDRLGCIFILDLGEGKADIHCSRHGAMAYCLKVPYLFEHSL